MRHSAGLHRGHLDVLTAPSACQALWSPKGFVVMLLHVILFFKCLLKLKAPQMANWTRQRDGYSGVFTDTVLPWPSPPTESSCCMQGDPYQTPRAQDRAHLSHVPIWGRNWPDAPSPGIASPAHHPFWVVWSFVSLWVCLPNRLGHIERRDCGFSCLYFFFPVYYISHIAFSLFGCMGS